MTRYRIAVVGGGITGLSLAYGLREHARAYGTALPLVVLESAPVVGGHVRTVREDGFVVEGGPNGFLDREPAVTALVGALGLNARLVDASAASSKRFILRRGVLRQVPQSAGTLIGSRLLSVRGRLRLALEPFVRRAPAGVEETVFDFARRRIGLEAADVLVDTAVSAQFPLMIEMERDHGSLLRAMIARRRQGIGAPKLRSFDGGMSVLTDRIADELGDAVRTRAEVKSVARDAAVWRIGLADGNTIVADRLILATSAARAAQMMSGFDPELAAALGGIAAAPVAVSGFAFRPDDVPRPLDGYGYLVAREERLATLGVLWESSLFPHRAPEGMVLLRVMMGGARSPHVASLDDEAVEQLALAELRQVMGITAQPARTWRFAGQGAISQYTLGHLERVTEIRRLASRHEGLSLCGTSYDGVSFGAAIASAAALADSLRGQLPSFQMG
jgi:oxygen-dependent protoporphyrinogen oxidase